MQSILTQTHWQAIMADNPESPKCNTPQEVARLMEEFEQNQAKLDAELAALGLPDFDNIEDIENHRPKPRMDQPAQIGANRKFHYCFRWQGGA